jgi:subtilisin family serine protease
VAVASFLLLALAPIDAHAQLRGLGGGGGGIGGTGIGGSVPGIGSSNLATGLPGAGPSLPSQQPEGVTFGLSVPTNFGATTPALPSPNVTGTLANSPTTAITNTLGTPLPNLGRPPVATPAQPRRSGVPPVGENRYVPDEVVVRLPSNLSAQTLDELARRHRLTRSDSQNIALIGTTIHRWRITDRRSVSDVIRGLEADAGVSGAQPNYRFTLQQSPAADGLQADQYALAKLNAPQAHRLATGNKVLVAVIDSGIDTSHPEIAGQVADSFDAVDSIDTAHSHGTAMAGAIIAHARLTGVAPAARILAVRAFDGSGASAEGTTLSILRGLDWAVARGARVINMSFAGPNDPEIALGLAAAQRKGVVLVAAAGNLGPKSPPLYPAADPNVIAVTATDAQDQLLAVASRGRHIAVAAPGVDILAPAPGGGYQLSTGTSIAAAQVSGVAALLLELQPGLKPGALRKILLSTATDLGPKGRDDQFGAGLTDANRAILALNAASAAARPKPTNVSAAR